jgi:hypothetical protein
MDINALLNKIQSAQQSIDARKTSGINATRPPMGETRWRILPGWRKSDRETFFHEFGKHWVKDAQGKVLATYICEQDTFKRPCAICDALREAIRSTKDDKILELLKEMTSRRGVLVNAVQIAGPQADPTKPVLLDLPPSLFDNTFIPLIGSRLADDINLLDLKEGRDIIIKRDGTGLSTRYNLTDAAKSTAVDPGLMDKVIDIDAWIASEKTRGDVKGVALLNDQIRQRLSGPSSGRPVGASLVSASSAAAALAPPMRSLEAADEVAADAPWVDAPRPAAKAKATKVEAPAKDDDLDALLADLDSN